jgi:DNA-directed RNA polymerase subunit alpha
MSISTLQMPERIEMEESTYSNTFGRFIVMPLEKGYGVTIGNTFRRVLLSSLQGSAITGIRIGEVLHEFTTIPGVYEDVTEIILNLKQIRLKLLNKKLERIVVPVKGPGNLTGEDLQRISSEIEILNPEKEIATLNEKADFEMELRLGRGRGYVPAEENKINDQPIGLIPIDSIFSPILNVKYHVENTRVGQRTDFEKLIIEIETDGSITPDDALTFSGKILKDHIQLFINFDIEPEEEEVSEIDEEILRIKKLLRMSVDELELSVRSHNCLKAANIKNIGDLVKRDETEMLRFRNFGRKSLTEINKILEERGLHFGMNVEKYMKNDEK